MNSHVLGNTKGSDAPGEQGRFNLRVRPLSTSILKENTGDRVKKDSPIQAEMSVCEHAGLEGGCVSEE